MHLCGREIWTELFINIKNSNVTIYTHFLLLTLPLYHIKKTTYINILQKINKRKMNKGNKTMLRKVLHYLTEDVTCGYWKQCLIIYLSFDPVHKQSNILGSWQWCWFLILPTISPQILEFWSTWHCRTRCGCAVFWHSSINEVDTIEEVYNCRNKQNKINVYLVHLTMCVGYAVH